MTAKSAFETLSVIDVGANVKPKGRFNYLSWVWAWTECKKKYPNMNSTVYENTEGLNYHHDGKTAWVKVGVSIEGLEHIEYYPVTDNSNNAITLEKLNSFDVNTAIQRATTKSIARHGLGLNVYAGEDLPLSEDDFLTDEELIVKNKEAQAKEMEEAEAQAKQQDLINNYIHTLQVNCANEEVGEVEMLFGEMSEKVKAYVWHGINQPTKDFINAIKAEKVA